MPVLFMNEWEIQGEVDRFQGDPVMEPATLTLQELMHAANQNSDGWCYWPKPARAAKTLMELIQTEHHRNDYQHPNPAPVTANQIRAAYRPIKAFRSRQHLEFPIIEPQATLQEALF